VTTVRELNSIPPIHCAQGGIVVETGTFTRVAVTPRQLGIIDLTPNRTDTGQARLLNIVPGRSRVFEISLAERPQGWRDRMNVVAMDWFTGIKTAAAEELPYAVPVKALSTSSSSPATR
jgi:hypothetical protein